MANVQPNQVCFAQALTFGFIDKFLTRRCWLGELVRSTLAGGIPEGPECMAAGGSIQGESADSLWSHQWSHPSCALAWRFSSAESAPGS